MFRVESKIADAVCRNPRLIKIGMKFEFKDVLNRSECHNSMTLSYQNILEYQGT